MALGMVSCTIGDAMNFLKHPYWLILILRVWSLCKCKIFVHHMCITCKMHRTVANSIIIPLHFARQSSSAWPASRCTMTIKQLTSTDLLSWAFTQLISKQMYAILLSIFRKWDTFSLHHDTWWEMKVLKTWTWLIQLFNLSQFYCPSSAIIVGDQTQYRYRPWWLGVLPEVDTNVACVGLG